MNNDRPNWYYVDFPRFIRATTPHGRILIPWAYWTALRHTLQERYGAALNVKYIHVNLTINLPGTSPDPFYYLHIVAPRQGARALSAYLRTELLAVASRYVHVPSPMSEHLPG